MIGAGNPGGLARRRRNILNPLGVGRKEIVVTNETEFREALSGIANRSTFFTTGLPSLGNVIIIGGNFSVANTILIPRQCAGLIIEGNGAFIAPSNPTPIPFILNNASFVTIRDVSVGPDSFLTPTKFFSAFVKSETSVVTGGDPDRLTLDSCICYVDTIIQANDTDSITLNNIWHNSATGLLPAIDLVDCRDAKITNCQIDGDVVVGSGCDYCSFVCNNFNGNDFTSSASSGFNVLVANTEVGTKTTAGSDIHTGLNT
jgi:hypothetical protein